MGREIKFRAWDGKKYYYQDDQYLSSFIWRFVRDVNYENGLNSEHESYLKSHLNNYLEQFTGLKDKNGVEIYEGDVVHGSYGIPPIGVRSFVEYENGCFMIKTEGHNPNQISLYEALSCLDMEVVGNIHEHPHLLEK